MQLQYLETLKQVGAAPSTKIVVPMELLGGLMNGLRGLTDEPSNDSSASGEVGPSGENGSGADLGTRAELGDGAGP